MVPFTNRTGDASLDNLGFRAADTIARQLTEMEELEVVPPSAVAAALGVGGSVNIDTRSLVGEVTAATSAGMVLTGVIDASGDRIELQAMLEDAIKGRGGPFVEAGDHKPVRTCAGHDDPRGKELHRRTSDHLHPSLTFGAGDDLPSLETYREFRRRFQLVDRGNLSRSFALMASTDFTRLRLILVAGFLNGSAIRGAEELLKAEVFSEADLNRHQTAIFLALQKWISGQ